MYLDTVLLKYESTESHVINKTVGIWLRNNITSGKKNKYEKTEENEEEKTEEENEDESSDD